MPKIKAAVAHEFGKPLKVEEVILRSPMNNEVEITLGAVAICHSDISYMEGAWGDTYLQYMDMKPQAKSVTSEITSKVCQLETELWLRLFVLAETA